MDKYTSLFQNYITSNEYLNKHYPDTLHEKLINLFGNGKRLRPILGLAFGSNTENTQFLNLLCSVETIHCLSLIMDDLPEMDNDTERRGQPSFHVKWGRFDTEMFIFYILNKLTVNIAAVAGMMYVENELTASGSLNSLNKTVKEKIYQKFFKNLNMLVDGQYMDLNNAATTFKDKPIIHFSDEMDIIFEKMENIDINNKTLTQSIEYNIELNIKKTASLFNLATLCGVLWQINTLNITDENLQQKTVKFPADNKDDDDFELDINVGEFMSMVDVWANIFGYLFQISDDVLDIEKDLQAGSPNICLIIGLENCRILIGKIAEWLKNGIIRIQQYAHFLHSDFNIYTDIILEMIVKIENRK